MKPEEVRLILASGSPRRDELLNTAGLFHEVIVSGASEDVRKDDPCRLVEKLSSRKAQEVYERIRQHLLRDHQDNSGKAQEACARIGQHLLRDCQEDDTEAVFPDIRISPEESYVVLGADTVVALDGVILGKPHDKADAARMLRMLSGKPHHVCTGVTLHGRINKAERVLIFSEVSTVHVADLSEEEISSYIATGEPMDKAGAYGIQGAFCRYVTHIEGDYFNIVGLPVSRVYRGLKQICC